MILFFYGPNSFASRRKLQAVVATFLTKTKSDLGLERIEGANTTVPNLIASLQAVPFLSSSRLVIVEYLSSNKAVSGQIDKVVSDVPTSTVVVFYEKDIDKRSNYYKTLKAQAQAQEFNQLSPARLTQWITAEAKRLGGSIDRVAANELLTIVGEDQWRLEQELLKLVSYQPVVTKQTITELIEPARDDNIFALVDAVSSGNTQVAIDRYHDILAAGSGELYILSMITWQLRNLILAKASGGMSPAELARETGLSPYVASKASARQASFTLDQLKAAFLAAVDTEYKIKTGAGAPEELVELLIYEVSGVKGR